ncbi:MAG: hypothetical protein LUB61_05985 [Eggerthellaceae bacterium]|nr:hypothetical protein [Eggerthellaceae bacterium]
MTIFNENCRIVSNEELGRDIWLMRLESASIAQSLLAGQFVDVLGP